MRIGRRTGVAFAVAALGAALVASPSAGAACSGAPYAYAGVSSSVRVAGVASTLTISSAPRVLDGHVAAWVGVGGVGAGPNGADEWLQVGLSAFPGSLRGSVYYEVARPGSAPSYHEVEADVPVGARRRVAVAELHGRPGWWRVWVGGRPVSAPIHLPGSHLAWRPTATAESWAGGSGVCNAYGYRFDRVQVSTSAGGAWQRLASGYRFADPGYRVLLSGRDAFVASHSAARRATREILGFRR